MNTFDAIADRRSIRGFDDRSIARADIERILTAATQAPSAKNAQPWRFVVLEGERNRTLARMMLDQAEKLKALGVGIGSLEWTAKSMLPAPVTIVVLNVRPPAEVPAEFHDDWNFVMLQSTGAAIENLLLAATDRGIGTLWICDILYARCEVLQWLGHPDDTLVAAVTLGHPAEAVPGPRPRRPWQEVTEWPEAAV